LANKEKKKKLSIWLIIGFLGQFIFGMRFLVQWIYSEKHKESVIPIQFWYLSICGGIILLIYAISIKDPVFIVGQSTGLLIYSRNLFFIYKKNKK
tara:strand:- start:102 stop:386 length:285 start_codon:yes stop_codon:yes gene_type:complete